MLHKTTVEVLMNVRPEDLVDPNPGAEVPKGNTRRPCGWVHGPDFLELLAMAGKRLAQIAELKGMNKVERVHVKLIKGTRIVVLQPAAAGDLTAVPVQRWASSRSAWINLYTLLAPEGITVGTGYKERFEGAHRFWGLYVTTSYTFNKYSCTKVFYTVLSSRLHQYFWRGGCSA